MLNPSKSSCSKKEISHSLCSPTLSFLSLKVSLIFVCENILNKVDNTFIKVTTRTLAFNVPLILSLCMWSSRWHLYSVLNLSWERWTIFVRFYSEFLVRIYIFYVTYLGLWFLILIKYCCRSSSKQYSPLDWAGYFDQEEDVCISDTNDVSVNCFGSYMAIFLFQ